MSKLNLGQLSPGPRNVVLTDMAVVEPDLLVVSCQRSHILRRENTKCALDLLVDILDPPNTASDRTVRLDLYALYEVQRVLHCRHGLQEDHGPLRGAGRFEVSGI